MIFLVEIRVKLSPKPEALDYNARWLQNKLDLNTPIYDLGPRGSLINSPFYNLEVGRTWGYPHLHPIQYNSYLGGKIRITKF